MRLQAQVAVPRHRPYPVHFLAGAAAVDVNLIIVVGVDHSCCRRQFLRVTASDLERQRALDFVERQVSVAILVVDDGCVHDHGRVQQRLGRDEAHEVPKVDVRDVLARDTGSMHACVNSRSTRAWWMQATYHHGCDA